MYTFVQIYIALNGPILKNNLAIWSHWIASVTSRVPKFEQSWSEIFAQHLDDESVRPFVFPFVQVDRNEGTKEGPEGQIILTEY